MSSIKKMAMMLGVLLASSSVLVSCSDDDTDVLGPCPVNSVQVTSTSVDIVWSIVPNDACAGYEMTLLQGSRDGAVLETKTYDNRTCYGGFTGLTPNTKYVIKSQALPGEGFSSSDVFYREFMTSPLMDVQVVSIDLYTTTGYNSEGVMETTPHYKVTLSWSAIPNTNCGSYNVDLYEGTKADFSNAEYIKDSMYLTTTSTVFDDLDEKTTYVLDCYTQGNSACDYSWGDSYLVEFTTPAFPAAE